MNIARRVAALKREIARREQDIARIAELRTKGDPATMAFPYRIDEHLEKVNTGLAQRRKEAAILELKADS